MEPQITKRLTRNAKEALEKSKKLGGSSDIKKINALFLLKSLSSQKGSLGKVILQNMKPSGKNLLTKQEINKRNTRITAYDVLIKAYQVANLSQTPFVGTEHLFHALLSLLAQKEKTLFNKYFKKGFSNLPGSGKTNGENHGHQFNSPDFMGEMNSLIENFFSSGGDKQKRSYLADFGTDFNEQAKKQDNILVGRETELERISNILGRKNKNNPVLIGEPGVGKTAIIEGLAQKINEGTAPFYLSNKKIIALDLGLLVAGTNFRGEFEARLKEVVKEAKENPDVILFIDELHNLVGAGNAVGGMDAANILKPALSRGEIQVIGATTTDEYRKNIEKDAALERRFQSIYIDEPDQKKTARILQGIKPLYEKYHNIKISNKVVSLAPQMAARYFSDKFLPDSAIDLIDESAAKKRTSSKNIDLYRRLSRKEEELKNITHSKENLVMADRYEEAIRLRDEERKAQDEIDELKKRLRQMEKKNPIKLEADDVREVVSIHSGIPVSLIKEKDSDTPAQVKKKLQKKLVGQKEIVEKIHQTLLRRSSGVTHPEKPFGSFLFIGSSGVGKTMTAKLLSEALSSASKGNLIQINMSEFMERHSVSRLLGAPAGYVGYEESGELTEKIRRNPYSVVLFDEIEKADKNVLNILLQILDEGEITDSKGRKVSFRNAVIVLTSNIGTNELNKFSKIGFGESKEKSLQNKEQIEQEIIAKLKEELPLEFINRLDSILIFNYLTKEDIGKIVKKELSGLSQRLKEKRIELAIDNSVIEDLAKKSYDSQQGARLVKKQIEELIEPVLAEKIASSAPRKINLRKSNQKIVATSR
ncbi:MAG: ATP-dependent Clp protease ATP-binding subunit [Candidatus Moranbacteria bacterium]|nr:ATP-dependent Clp protease ATP-binding subunit [Candidatus Moranbacteria bacterium]